MIVVKWTGKAVSENRRLVPGKTRLQATQQYEGFINSLGWQIRADSPWIAGIKKINLLIHVTIWKMRDKQNLLKPICDAVQRSGLIENDRDIETIHIMPAEYHKRDELDHIWLFISEAR